jgi:hypothetical protein
MTNVKFSYEIHFANKFEDAFGRYVGTFAHSNGWLTAHLFYSGGKYQALFRPPRNLPNQK